MLQELRKSELNGSLNITHDARVLNVYVCRVFVYISVYAFVALTPAIAVANSFGALLSNELPGSEFV